VRGPGDVLNLLQGVKSHGQGQYSARCPAHEDSHASLSIKATPEKVLLTCHAGCSLEAICDALHLKVSDLFIDSKQPVAARAATASPKGQIAATYSYTDEAGAELFQVVRMDPKDFRQRHRNGTGEYVWNLDGVRRVLYHLPEVLASDTVYLVEGEKDADNLRKCGLCATTNCGGAQAWKDEYAAPLKGKCVVLIPDKDEPGMELARARATSLKGLVDPLVIILPGETVKDVSDWLEQGGDPAEFPGMAQGVDVLYEEAPVRYRDVGQAIQWDSTVGNQDLRFRAEKVSEERTGVHARVSVSMEGRLLGWSYLNVERSEDRVRLANSCHAQIQGDTAKRYSKENLRRDLDRFCAGLWEFRQSLYLPEEMVGDDTVPMSFALKPYVLDGGGTVVFAAPGRGKSFTLLLWLVCIDAGISLWWPVRQQRVLLINLERSKQSMARRLAQVNRILGLPDNRPLATLNARGKALSAVVSSCQKFVSEKGVSVIGLDSISRAGYGDLNENEPTNRIVDSLSALCPTWIGLAHTSRATEEHSYGSIMLDAGADVCVRLTSEMPDETKLGVCYTITKQNDIGKTWPSYYCLEFGEGGLKGMRGAKEGEFLELEGKDPRSKLAQIVDFILEQDSEEATATQISTGTGLRRDEVSRILAKHKETFEVSRKVKQSVYYRTKPKTDIPKAFEY